MLGIEVGVEEAYRNSLDRFGAQPRRESTDFGLVDRPLDLSVGEHALADLEAEFAVDERRRLPPEQVVHVGYPEPS